MVARKFRKQGERAIISFDFVDAANGTGNVVYHGASTKIDTTSDYFLTRINVFSNDIETSVSANQTSFTKEIDLDFDLSVFNVPQTINGTGYVNLTFVVDAVTNLDCQGYIIAKIIKNADEETLATIQSETITSAAGTDILKTICLPFTINKKTFKIGDFIRVTIEGWLRRTDASSGNVTITIGHDPQGRDGLKIIPSSDVDVTTKMDIHVPFKITL